MTPVLKRNLIAGLLTVAGLGVAYYHYVADPLLSLAAAQAKYASTSHAALPPVKVMEADALDPRKALEKLAVLYQVYGGPVSMSFVDGEPAGWAERVAATSPGTFAGQLVNCTSATPLLVQSSTVGTAGPVKSMKDLVNRPRVAVEQYKSGKTLAVMAIPRASWQPFDFDLSAKPPEKTKVYCAASVKKPAPWLALGLNAQDVAARTQGTAGKRVVEKGGFRFEVSPSYNEKLQLRAVMLSYKSAHQEQAEAAYKVVLSQFEGVKPAKAHWISQTHGGQRVASGSTLFDSATSGLDAQASWKCNVALKPGQAECLVTFAMR